MAQIYLSIGSNVDRRHSIQRALQRLTETFGELEVSPTYECPAEGFDGQPFWNLAVAARSELSPGDIDRALKSIEAELGRKRNGQPKFSDRTIDIDLIIYGDWVGTHDGIELPRDEIERYAFVLKPILDLAPTGAHPVSGEQFTELWRRMTDDGQTTLRRLDDPTLLLGQQQPTPTASELTIAANDGFELAASWFPAIGSTAVLVVNSATAVPRQFYRRFAQYAQTRGYSVLSWDYRGIGGSRPKSLRGFQANMSDWALHDMVGVFDWVRTEHQAAKLCVIGHSAGGQLMGLLPDSSAIDRMATISAQSGYWKLQGGNEPRKVRLMVSVVLPMLSRLFGYMPWSLLGAGLDLPKGVALQWSRWCRSPGYLLDDDSLPLERYADFVAPILAYSIDDDDWGTAQSVDAMMSAYPNVERRHAKAADYNVEKFGHMGAFKAGAEQLWDEMLAWLGQTDVSTD